MEPYWKNPGEGLLDAIDIPSKSYNVTCATVSEKHPRLLQVEYPGFVVNPANAVRTLGGIHKVSQILSNPKKKLEVRFRPGDVYCKPAYGEPHVTCGLLIKLRRRKSAAAEVQKAAEPDEKPALIELSHLPDDTNDDEDEFEEEDEDHTTTSLLSRTCVTPYKLIETGNKQQVAVFDGPLPDSIRDALDKKLKKSQNKGEEEPQSSDDRFEEGIQILKEEEKFLADVTLRKRFESCLNAEGLYRKDVRTTINQNRIYLKVPNNLAEIRAPLSNLQLEVLGVIPRKYKFRGMCDFQYLPMKRTKKRHVSILNKILPAFGNPDLPNSSIDDLLVCKLGKEGHDKHIPSFLVPNIMSRVDKPHEGLLGFLEGGIARDLARKHKVQTLSTTRAKRVVYSHLCNFRVTNNKINSSECLIPTTAMQQAQDEAEKRHLLGPQLDCVKKLFEQRPIYTKIQIEHECEVGRYSLRYLLPLVAYFALNGPWRSCWIRYGYDPRKDRFAFRYQLLDFRVPNSYRVLMQRKRNTTIEVEREQLFRYLPDTVPPKCQMFYQICEIKIKEVDEAIKAVHIRMADDERRKFHPRFGFLNEDLIEHIRYCLSRQIEMSLYNQGKIPAVTLPELPLPSIDGTNSKPRFAQGTVRRAGEKRRFRHKPRPNPLLADEVSNQSSNVTDLKIHGHFVEDVKDSLGNSAEEEDEEEDEDEDDLVLQEALDAATVDDLEDDDLEQDEEFQILGLE